MDNLLLGHLGGEMNAGQRNESYRLLFHGGLGVLLWGYQEMDRQFAEANAGRRAEFAYQREMQNWIIEECPCGCGLKNDFCDAHLAAIAAREELPF